ncbi:Ig-like domain-containing protein [Pseudomonas veronii]|uniref:Ig-like domain-containing protein n=1 Tax=Pseudomonas veronii TaxID=76761 RepID=UPI0021BEA495|nr:Ig-like domain-containing protein [Pseudomonas veronii]MCT9825951.1 Ig-like domain-containing protein [Pseudomonas veronii]
MNWIKSTGLLAVTLMSVVFSAQLLAATQCVESGEALSLNPVVAVVGETLNVTYTLDRVGCSSIGSYSLPINIGSPKGANIGKCEGVRSKESFSCTGVATLPQGFTGPLVISVGKALAETIVERKKTQPHVDDMEVLNNEDETLLIPLTLTGAGVQAESFEILDMPSEEIGQFLLSGSTVTFKPIPQWYGITSFTYRGKDTTGNFSNPATVRVVTSLVNDAPNLIPHPAIGVEDKPFVYVPVVQDPDQVDIYQLVVEAQGAHVTASVEPDLHSLKIVPEKDWNGTDTLKISAVDSANAKSDVMTVRVVIQPESDAPILTPVAITANEDSEGRAKIVFSDPDGKAPYRFLIDKQPPPSAGGCGIDVDEVVFTPAKNWNGTTDCSVVVVDADSGASLPSKVSITVSAVADKPVVETKTLTLNQGDTSTFSLVVTDPDVGDSFSLSSSSSQDAAFGSFSFTGSTITVALNPAFVGTRSISYTAKDSSGLVSAPGELTIKVLPVGKKPVVASGQASTGIDTPVTLELMATDPNHDAPLAFAISQTVPVTSGSLSLNGNRLTFTPAAGFVGTATANVVATDPGGLVSAPQAVSFIVQDDQTVAFDPDNPDSHTIIIVQQPNAAAGVITVNGMSLTFTPVQGYFGTATFTYKLRDLAGLESDTKQGTIDVAKTNYAPTSANVAISVNEGEASSPALPTVVDENLYDAGLHTFTIPIQSMTGVAEVVNNRIIYHAPYGASGTKTFKFIARDVAGAEVVGLATVNVVAKNFPPSSVDLSLDTLESTPVSGVPVVVDPNPNDTFTYTIDSSPIGGTAAVVSGKVVYTPTANWVGSDRFAISAYDAAGVRVTGLAFVTVRPSNVAPLSLTGSITVPENTTSAPYYPVIVDKNLYDMGKHQLVVKVQPANGLVSVVGNRLVYTPKKDFIGDDTVAVEATDLGGLTVQGIVALHVTMNNLQPETAMLKIVTYENTPSAETAPTVVDPNAWDQFTYEVIAQPEHGSVVAGAKGYVYTPQSKYTGNDSFAFRVVDVGGKYVESVAKVSVLRKNTAPTGVTPNTLYFYEGIGGKQRLAAIDDNLWGSHTIEVQSQPGHGFTWFDNDELNFKTDGRTETTMTVKVTDQDGLSVVVPVRLVPKSIDSVIDQLPVQELAGDKVATPAITKEFLRVDGRPGLLLTDKDAIAALGSDIVAVIEKTSTVGLRVGRRPLAPSQGTRLAVEYFTADALGSALAGIETSASGHGRVLLVRGDLTGTAYAIPFEVWKLEGAVKTSADTAPLGLQAVRAQFEPSNTVCLNTVRQASAVNGNPYDNPVCLLEFTQKLPEFKDLSSDSTLVMTGTATDVGTYPIEVTSYIVGANGEKNLLATYTKSAEFVSPVGAVKVGPKYPFTTAYYKVEDLDIEYVQQAGPPCDLTIIERRAISAAASFNTRPLCLLEWDEIPVGMVARPNWERPYLQGTATMLGLNTSSWRLSVFTPSGKKIDLGPDTFTFTAIEPSTATVTYVSSTKVSDTLLTSPLDGAYIGDAVIQSVSARLMLQHNLNLGVEQTEDAAPAYGAISKIYRRIYTAPFDALWQMKKLHVDAAYKVLPDISTHTEVDVLAVPDESVVPIIDNENGKVLSTESLEVGVTMGDAFNDQKVYSPDTMGEWEIRLILKPTWNTVTELAPWQKTDGVGHAAFAIPVDELAGKNLRIYAEARVISPVPEYKVTRTSPRPLSLAILNGAALDGSIRALRLTGEAPLRITLFADVTNRAWAKDLGAVRWELSTEGGPWVELPNKSRTPQRIAMTLLKGNYKVRAELTNKHSGAKSMTDEIEVIVYNIPKGVLKGPGNTFIDASARFRVLQLDGQPIDLSNIDVEWSLDRGKTWAPGNDTNIQTRSTEARVSVYARMRFKEAPVDDVHVWKVLRSGVAFRKIRPPRVQLIGPRRPEVGKETTWIANMLMPYPNMDLTMGGEFIMPDGTTIVPGQEAKYTPVDADITDSKTYLSYRAWIEGYRDRGGEGITQQRITFWIYDWPEWAIQPTFSAEYAPAELSLRVRNIGEFKAVEGVYYDWEMPAMPGYEVVKDDTMVLRMLNILEPAVYPFKVHVYDARGNYSLVERLMTFKEPPPWTINLLWNGDNNASRAPLGIMVRPQISGGHPKDRITSLKYKLNGEEIDTGGSRYARATLPTEGQYQVDLEIETLMNKGSDGKVDIDVKKNQPPTCELQVKEGGSAWSALAKCTDPDGRIARHNWYVNDKVQGLGGSAITISKRTYPDAPKIVLFATDDSGEDSAPVIW